MLGTGVTMRSNAYAQKLAARGVVANARLDEATIDHMQHQIDHAVHATPVPPNAYRDLLSVCERFVSDPKDTAILLACTELPLAFPDHLEDPVFESDGFTFINTSSAHIRAALTKAIEDQMKHGKTTLIEAMINQELGEPFRRDAMKKPVAVAGISASDMVAQKV